MQHFVLMYDIEKFVGAGQIKNSGEMNGVITQTYSLPIVNINYI